MQPSNYYFQINSAFHNGGLWRIVYWNRQTVSGKAGVVVRNFKIFYFSITSELCYVGTKGEIQRHGRLSNVGKEKQRYLRVWLDISRRKTEHLVLIVSSIEIRSFRGSRFAKMMMFCLM